MFVFRKCKKFSFQNSGNAREDKNGRIWIIFGP